MRCTKCGTENLGGKKFCSQCGSGLAVSCPKCGTENAPASRFCGDCGAGLGANAPSGAAPPTSTAPAISVAREQPEMLATDGERKTVSALFADIKGSMDLMEDLDPEEARAIVDPALKLMIDATHRYGGYIVQSTGDGIFALFGAPIAHEDHPQRALYSALLMQNEVKGYAEKLRAEKGVNLQVRVGVNSGEVVVRSIETDAAHTEYTPIGHSTSLASRLQALASPGSIAVSETVRKLVEGYFALKPLGPARIKGVSEPVNIYEVIGLGPLRTRLQRSAGRGLTKFVGRAREIEQLRHASDLAISGKGQVVATVGEPGVGKSRLLHEFKAISAGDSAVLESYSVSHGKASAFLPLIELLKAYFRITEDDDQRLKREKVTGKVLALDRQLEDALPSLFSLLSISDSNSDSVDAFGLSQIVDPDARARRIIEAIKRLLLRESLNQPLTIVFEDLHWIDSESQKFLELLVESIASARVLLLINFRPEYRHQWGNKTYYTQLRLDPLGKENAGEMLTALLGENPELQPVKQFVIERTEGTPFFIEEMVQSLFDEAVLVRNGVVRIVRPLTAVQIPGNVQGVLAARIDRLGAREKELLQTLAVLGKEIPLKLACAVAGTAGDELQVLLANLQSAEFVYEQPAFPEAEYVFKHALTQEVAYNSLLMERRRQLHKRAASAIETIFSGVIADHYVELARHWRLSSDIARATEYLALAGREAASKSAYREASSHLQAALELLKTMPDGNERKRRELEVQMSLGDAFGLIRGPTEAQTIATWNRARELGIELGDRRSQLRALRYLRFFYSLNESYSRGLEIAADAVRLAREVGDPDEIAAALMGMGFNYFGAGDFINAKECAERALQKARGGGTKMAERTESLALSVLALALCMLGFADQARKLGQQALSITPPGTVEANMQNASSIFYFLREFPRLQEMADRLVGIASRYGFPRFSAMARLEVAVCLANSGDFDRAIAQAKEAIEDFRTTGAPVAARVLHYLVEILLMARRADEGLRVLADAGEPAGAESSELREGAASIDFPRLRGELLLIKNPPDPETAEASFRRGIELARTRECRWRELQATTSLARLLRDTNRRDEARAMLAEIYNWFTEGFDTQDLKDAKALLEELSD